MKTKIIEAGNSPVFNWGKFMVMRLTQEEWQRRSAIPHDFPTGRSMLRQIGWSPQDIIVFDLQTCEGASFRPGGYAKADLDKHKIWVCPLFEPFLAWLYKQPLADLDALPDFVDLGDVPSAMAGYRRPGPQEGV